MERELLSRIIKIVRAHAQNEGINQTSLGIVKCIKTLEYLVVPVHLPAVAEVREAAPGKPYLCLLTEIDIPLVREISRPNRRPWSRGPRRRTGAKHGIRDFSLCCNSCSKANNTLGEPTISVSLQQHKTLPPIWKQGVFNWHRQVCTY